MTPSPYVESTVPESTLSRIEHRSRSKARLCAQAFVLWIYISTLGGAQSINLLSNASFENVRPDPWQLVHTSTAAAIPQSDSVDGAQSLMLSSGATASQSVSLGAGVYELH